MDRISMGMASIFVTFATVPLLVAAGSAPGALAQTPEFSAALHTGTCEVVGDLVAPLSDSLVAPGERIGADQAVPAASSFSTIPVSLDALVGVEHVILIPHPAQGSDLACGEVGGILAEDGSLVMGLRDEEDSGVTGVAYVSPGDDPSQTNVSLFVTGESLDDLAGDPVTAGQVTESEELPVANEGSETDVGFTADEQAYANEVTRITQTMSESFGQFTDLMNTPQFGDDTWTLNVATQFAIWQASYDDALALSPPPVFADMHALLLESLRLYSEAGNDAARGIDAFDVELLEQAASKMNEALSLLNQAQEEMEEIAQERGA